MGASNGEGGESSGAAASVMGINNEPPKREKKKITRPLRRDSFQSAVKPGQLRVTARPSHTAVASGITRKKNEPERERINIKHQKLPLRNVRRSSGRTTVKKKHHQQKEDKLPPPPKKNDAQSCRRRRPFVRRGHRRRRGRLGRRRRRGSASQGRRCCCRCRCCCCCCRRCDDSNRSKEQRSRNAEHNDSNKHSSLVPVCSHRCVLGVYGVYGVCVCAYAVACSHFSVAKVRCTLAH